MEHPYLFFVKLFEMIGFGHFAHANVHVVYAWVVMAILIILGFLAGKNTKLIPSQVQNVFEVLVSGLEEFMIGVTGEKGRWIFPLVATIFLYVFVSNLIGLVPGFFPPTANLNTTLSIALIVVPFTHIVGIKYHGIKYIKHFLGPVWWMIPIIFPIEVTIRLGFGIGIKLSQSLILLLYLFVRNLIQFSILFNSSLLKYSPVLFKLLSSIFPFTPK